MLEKQTRSNYPAAGAICVVLGFMIVQPVYADGLDIQVPNHPQETIHNVDSPNGGTNDAGLILGKNLRDEEGEIIGNVTSLVTANDDQQLYAVVHLDKSSGSTKDIAIPFSQIRIMPDEILVQSALDLAGFAEMPAYRPEDFTPARGYLPG